jgi:uncharacterized low-complexity protein
MFIPCKAVNKTEQPLKTQEIRKMSKKQMKPVVAAIGAAVVGSLTLGTATAAENPFGLSELGSGYMQLASSHMEGKCGGDKDKEGKCGEGKCGGDKDMEGKCGGDKDMEGKCGGDKGMEGKCGEGKCGGDKGMEGKCGGDKDMEGKCGGDKGMEGKCGSAK